METHASTKPSRTLFIVDPYLVTPENEACWFLEREWHTLAAVLSGRPVGKVERFTPAKEGVTPLRQALKNQKPLAVVCLGSFANLTESRPWMQELGACLLHEVVDANVPFLGICFSHQLLAYSTGEWAVGPVPRARLPASGKWDGPRVVTATHPKLRLLFLPFDAHERGLASARNLEFQWCLTETRTWSAARWTTLFNAPWQRLSSREERVRRFVETECPVGVECMAAHEQEILGRTDVPGATDRLTADPRALIPAAQSDECRFEAFVHETACAFTFQAHPERLPASQGLLSNFLYLALQFGSQGTEGSDTREV